MPKYDAFGREIGEDTLSGLGSGAPAPQATPEPAPAPADSWTEQARPAADVPPPRSSPPQTMFTVPTAAIPGVRRRRGASGFGCLIGLVILAAVVTGPVIAIVALVGAADDALDEVTGVIDGAADNPAIDTPAVPEEAAPPPVGLGGRSMVAAGNFRGALKRVGDAGLGKTTLIRLSPDRASLQLVKGGKQRGAAIDYLGKFDRGTATGGGRGANAVALSAIDPAAPARLVRESVRRGGVKAKGINYLILSTATDGSHYWAAYFKNERYILGDAKGRFVRRIN